MFAEMIEDYDWESDESEDWESDEAFAEADEADEAAEDIGERARRRRRARNLSRTVRPFKPVGGIKGLTVRGPDGRARNLPFPTKLATAAQTNQGLAKQELARRALAGRVSDLEAKRRKDLKNASQATSLVSLAMIGGLSGYAAFQAMEKPSGSRFKGWVEQAPTQMATAASAAQLVGSGASYLFTGGYHGGAVRIAADAVAAVQIAAFSFGSLYEPKAKAAPKPVKGGIANAKAENFDDGALILDVDAKQLYEVIIDSLTVKHFVLARN
ncbi:MAG: hypothetical protein WBD27_07095 [Pyrinomonadaceae bacterium]